MSSFIEWPSIYGSSYFIPAVVVVVLLLALLLLMSSRRRATGEAARNAAEPFDEAETLPPAPAEDVEAEATAVPTYEADAVAAVAYPMAAPAVVAAPSPSVADASMASAPEVLPVMAVAAAEAASPIPDLDLAQLATGRNIRVTVRAQGPVSGAAGNDPLNAALLDILGGWGDLSPEDMKRLELFRPERLAAAAAAIQLPKSKSGEAKARLSQLRQYSADLERRSLAAQAAAPVPQAVPEAAVAAAWTAGAPEAAPVAAQAATVVPPPTADRAAAAALPSTGITAGLAAAIALGAARRTTPESLTESSAETGLETAAAVAGTAAVTQRSGVNELASFWADPRPLWETDTQVSFQELPAPTYQEVEARPNGDGNEAERKELYPPLTAVPMTDASETSEPQTSAPRTGPPLTSVDTFFWDDPPADSLSRLSVKVETAEQLLALPPQERVDMTAFLGPSELAATFRATEDPELKMAVIDTLEHIGSPASLNALGNCFEDNSCDIQLYALEAADRLLGVA